MTYEHVLMATYGFQTGGAEVLASDLALYLRDKGKQVSMLATHGDHGPISDHLRSEGIPCYLVESEKRNPVSRRWRIFKLFRELRPDIFHAHHFALFQYCHPPARIACRSNCVVTEHTDFEYTRYPEYLKAAQYSATQADAITVVHEGMRESFTDRVVVDAAKVHTFENGVDVDVFRPLDSPSEFRSSIAASSDDTLIGFVGRLHHQKNVDGLIRAFRLTRDAFPRSRLVLVGDGPDEMELKALADAEGGLSSDPFPRTS